MFEVIVGNIGSVYQGSDKSVALKKFETYKSQSENNCGRAAGENVVLMENDDIKEEFVGRLESETMEDEEYYKE